MTLNQVHVEFWTSRQPQPKWISKLKRPERHTSMIDSCVNAHAGLPEIDKSRTAHNLLALLHMHRKRAPLWPFLMKIAAEPGTVIEPVKRAAFARKWAFRILRDIRAA